MLITSHTDDDAIMTQNTKMDPQTMPSSSTTPVTIQQGNRMYCEERNNSIVGIRDVPKHLIPSTNKSKNLLTPIFSIPISTIEEAFNKYLRGEIEDYTEAFQLRKKYSTSKLSIRSTINPDDFGWIEDLAILKQMPLEYTALMDKVDTLFTEYEKKAFANALDKASTLVSTAKGLNLESALKQESTLQLARKLVK